MDQLLQDVRHAVRSLSASPGFVLLSVLCLSLGIGATTTAFSVVNGLLLQPLPLHQPERLLIVQEVRHDNPAAPGRASYQNFRNWREQAAGAPDLAAMGVMRVTLAEGAEAERYNAALASANLLPLLGAAPIAGRGFREDEDARGGAPVAMLSEDLWRQRYGSDPAVVGRSVLIDGTAHTVVGITPRLGHPLLPGAFRSSRVWLPLAPAKHDSPRGERTLMVYARVRDREPAADAAARVTAIARTLEREHPENQGWGVRLDPLSPSVSSTTRTMLLIMMGAVVFVLLIACANVANLMLARATSRRREIAIRTALGASRGRIVGQLLIESLIVWLLAVPAGLMLASWAIDLLIHSGPEQATSVSLPIDGRVLTFTIGMAIATSLLFGLAPALQAIRGATREALDAGGRESTAARPQRRLRDALVVGEVALSLVLLVGAALFVRSFFGLMRVEVGFDTSPVLTTRVELPDDRYPSPDAIARRVDDILSRVEAQPGVAAAAAATLLPLRGGGTRSAVVLDGEQAPPRESRPVIANGVSSRFFRTLEVPIVQGRAFTEAEGRSRSAVAVINQRMAARVWPAGDALGQRFRLAADTTGVWFTVVGISRDIANWDLSDRPMPSAYLPFPHATDSEPRLIVRASGDPAAVAATVRDAVQAADPLLTLKDVRPMAQVHREAFWRNELFGSVLASFGGVALLLAAVGVYGVLSYLVSQRTREVGVRLALGARRADVVRLVVRQGMTLVLGGVGLGLVGAFAVTRLLRRQLHAVSPTDPVGFASVALLLIAAGFLASYIPASRAASVDPIESLRR